MFEDEQVSTGPATSPNAMALRDEFVRSGGRWTAVHERLIESDPEFAKVMLQFLLVPRRKQQLEPRISELVRIVIAASTTTLDIGGFRHALGRAQDVGVTRAEVVEAIALVSILGMHSPVESVSIVVEELAAIGVDVAARALDPVQEELSNRFLRGRGYWDRFGAEFQNFLDGLLHLSPELFQAFMDLTLLPWQTGPLQPKEKELLYVAMDVVTTHLYMPGARLHIRNALAFGASVGEIMEVLEIASEMGLRSVEFAFPVIDEVFGVDADPVITQVEGD